MAKNDIVEKQRLEEDDDFDFSMFDPDLEDQDVLEMMNGLIESSKHQMNVSLELTKLIVEKDAAAGSNEASILGVFERASKVVSSHFPLKNLMDRVTA